MRAIPFFPSWSLLLFGLLPPRGALRLHGMPCVSALQMLVEVESGFLPVKIGFGVFLRVALHLQSFAG